jgi:hypothetical protein
MKVRDDSRGADHLVFECLLSTALLPGQSEGSTRNKLLSDWQELLQSCDNNASKISSFSTDCSSFPRIHRMPKYASFQIAETLPFAIEVMKRRLQLQERSGLKTQARN